jgi:cytochrome c oxidase subunit 1
MFTTGLGKIATAAFSLLTMAIAVPTGVKIFNWVGTLWGGKIRFHAPMIFAIGFVWMFMLGGFSGIMHSSAPADAQQQDSYFVIAHFHYVAIGGILLAIISGIYYWLPKMIGKMWQGSLNIWVGILTVVGLNITFFPMHFLGLLGQPRRTHTYLSGFGWESYNMVCTIGSYILALGVLLLVVDIIRCFRSKQLAGDDPWDARTLEWATSSPPKVYNFAATPVINARDAYWAQKYGPENRKLGTVEESHGIHMPSQSWMPLIASAGFIPLGLGLSMMQAGVPYMGYVTILGLVIIALGISLWALEGPGGYHLHPKKETN